MYSQVANEDDDNLVTFLYDTIRHSFNLDYYDLEINRRQSELCNQKRQIIRNKIDTLNTYYTKHELWKNPIRADSVLMLAADLYREYDRHLEPYVVDKKTIFIAFRAVQQVKAVKHWNNDTIPLITNYWKIDSLDYAVSQPSTNSPLELAIKVDSLKRQWNSFDLYYTLYRQGLTQPIGTLYSVNVNGRQLKLKERNNYKHPPLLISMTARPLCYIFVYDNAFIQNSGYSIPDEDVDLLALGEGVLYKRKFSFWKYLLSGNGEYFDRYRTPISTTGSAMIQSARNYFQRKAAEGKAK